MLRTRLILAAVTSALCFGSLGLAAAETAVIVVRDYRFQPDEITVKVGDTVRWENQEKRQYHSVWFRELGDKSGDYFFPGETRERTFSKPGDYHFVCEPHEKTHAMKGTVHVVE